MTRACEPVGDELAGRLDPVEHRHADVHEDHVGSCRRGGADGLARRRRLANDLDLRLGVEDRPEAPAHERLIVADQDADVTAAARRAEAAR